MACRSSQAALPIAIGTNSIQIVVRNLPRYSQYAAANAKATTAHTKGERRLIATARALLALYTMSSRTIVNNPEATSATRPAATLLKIRTICLTLFPRSNRSLSRYRARSWPRAWRESRYLHRCKGVGAAIYALNASIRERSGDRSILLRSCELQSARLKWLTALKAQGFD